MKGTKDSSKMCHPKEQNNLTHFTIMIIASGAAWEITIKVMQKMHTSTFTANL